MCLHQGDPSAPCPTCECGCGVVTELYSRGNTRDGAVKGHHKRFINGHQGKTNGGQQWADVVIPEEEKTENEKLLAKLLSQALVSGATGDELVRIFIDSQELAAAIVAAQVVKALNGSIQSANWLFQRGIGTATKKGNNASQKIDVGEIFGNPLDSEDEMWDEDD